jgi:hypothetical protein
MKMEAALGSVVASEGCGGAAGTTAEEFWCAGTARKTSDTGGTAAGVTVGRPPVTEGAAVAGRGSDASGAGDLAGAGVGALLRGAGVVTPGTDIGIAWAGEGSADA